MNVMELLGALVMLGGGFFVTVGAVGVVKMPDVYCRAHALGKALTLGIMLLLVGYGLRLPDAPWFKIGFAMVLQLVTIPVASHLFCFVAYRKGVRRWRD